MPRLAGTAFLKIKESIVKGRTERSKRREFFLKLVNELPVAKAGTHLKNNSNIKANYGIFLNYGVSHVFHGLYFLNMEHMRDAKIYSRPS